MLKEGCTAVYSKSFFTSLKRTNQWYFARIFFTTYAFFFFFNKSSCKPLLVSGFNMVLSLVYLAGISQSFWYVDVPYPQVGILEALGKGWVS